MTLDPCPPDTELKRIAEERTARGPLRGKLPPLIQGEGFSVSLNAPHMRRKRKKKPHRVHNHPPNEPPCQEVKVKGKLYGACILAEKTERAVKLKKQREKTEENAHKFKTMCVAAGLPLPVREFRFAAPERAWEADFCFVDEKVCLEVEGGAWSGGRHTIGSGYLQDMEKYNQMTLRGFKLLRCTPSTLCHPETVEMVRRALKHSEAA